MLVHDLARYGGGADFSFFHYQMLYFIKGFEIDMAEMAIH